MTCTLQIGKGRYRALLDTGSDICLVRKDIFDQISSDCTLSMRPSPYIVRTANGKVMKLLGETDLKLKIGTQTLCYTFQICPEIRHPMILGTDFLKEFDCKIWLSRNILNINSEDVYLTDYETIVSLVRLAENVEIPPQQMLTTYGKYNRNKQMPTNVQNYVLDLKQADNGFLQNEPGLAVCNSISHIHKNRLVPLTIVNMTQKHFCLKKGNVVAQIQLLKESELCSVHVDNSASLPDQNEYFNLDTVSMENELTADQEKELKDLILKNQDVFAKSDFDIGKTTLLEAKINTGNHPPIRKSPYKAPFSKQKEMKDQIEKMLKAGIISPSISSWSFPIILIPKKTGDTRMVVDLRSLNSITQKFHFPLPQLDQILAKLAGSKIFSSLDLQKAFFQIPLDKKSRPKTAFICEEGLFEYNVLPFGWTNSPGFFSKLMSMVFEGSTNTLNYMDDLITFSDTFSNHLIALQDCFDRLRKAGLKLRLSKCQFVKSQVNYLGHTISAEGVTPDMSKIEAIKQIPRPTTVKQVRQFLGCTSYYRKFIPNYSKIAEPLTALTRKHVTFEWNTHRQNAFDILKKCLQEPPILAMPQVKTGNFKLYCDASSSAIGSVLCQTQGGFDKPISYFSHQLSKSQQKWSIIEKETYSLVLSIQHFRPYLYGQSFTVYSDHAPLKFIESAEMKNPRVQRWATIISQSGGNVKYIKGKDNCQADFLSRLKTSPPPGKEIKQLEEKLNANVINADHLPTFKMTKPSDDTQTVWQPEFRPTVMIDDFDLEQAQKDDPVLGPIREQLLLNDKESKKSNYILLDQIVYYVDRDENLLLEIPQSIQHQLIEEIHQGCCGGHAGRDRTYHKMRSRYHWPGMTNDIYNYMKKCIPCNSANLNPIEPPLQEMTFPNYPFESIAVDTCGPYPTTESGNIYIITVIDLFTGYVEAFAVPDKTSTTVAKILMDNIIPRHGSPRSLLTDNGLEYSNEVINKLSETFKIHRIKTSIYHPRSDGKVERSHKVLVSFLSKLTPQQKLNWDSYLPSFCAAHNSSQSKGSRFSPFFLLYGRDMVLPADTILAPRTKYLGEDYFPQSLEKMHTTFKLVRRHIRQQTEKNKKYHDKKSNVKEVSFNLGDAVYFKNHERQNKLDTKWIPHYRVIKVKGPTSYMIKDQITGKVKSVHAKDLRIATESDLWGKQIPTPTKMRPSKLVVPPSDNENSEYESDMSEPSSNTSVGQDSHNSSDEENVPGLSVGSPQLVTKEVTSKQTENKESLPVEDTDSSRVMHADKKDTEADINENDDENDMLTENSENREVMSKDDKDSLSEMNLDVSKQEASYSPHKSRGKVRESTKRKSSASPTTTSSEYSSEDELPLSIIKEKIRKPAKRQRQAKADANIKLKLLKDVISVLSELN